MFISISYKYMLTTKLLTQRGLPFSSPWEAWKHEKCRKIGWKTLRIRGFFKTFNFAVLLRCFKATWGSLEVSLGCPEASWRRLGASWWILSVLAASWGPRGRLGRVMGAYWDVLRAFWERFGPSWGRLVVSWKHHVETCRLGSYFTLDVLWILLQK